MAFTKALASVTIPGHAITAYDVDYEYGHGYDWTRTPRREITIKATEATMNYTKSVLDAQRQLESFYEAPATPRKAIAPMKRRVIHVFKEGDKYKVVAVGFRESEYEAINMWAAGETAALVLDYDAPEVDVKYVYTGE